MKDWEESEGGQTKVMTAAVFNQNCGPKKQFACHYCGRPGHLRCNCRKLAFKLANVDKRDKSGFKAKKEIKHKANNATSGHSN